MTSPDAPSTSRITFLEVDLGRINALIPANKDIVIHATGRHLAPMRPAQGIFFYSPPFIPITSGTITPAAQIYVSECVGMQIQIELVSRVEGLLAGKENVGICVRILAGGPTFRKSGPELGPKSRLIHTCAHM